jgi:CRISPR/Cas system-associated exonuclease Cas4 (RecB family)
MKFAPYSISKIGTYFQCPHKFKLQYISKLKVPFETNVALLKGSHIHKILENNFDYNIPFEIGDVYTQEHFNKTIEIVKIFEKSELGMTTKKLQKIGVPEEDFAFTFNKDLVGYWDKTAHFRGSADLYVTNNDLGIIVDYKSGKDKSKEDGFGDDQSKMYAIYMFIKYPEIQNVKASFFFIEHNTKKTLEYTRDNLNDYIDYFKKKIEIVESDSSYKKQVTSLCDYCSFKFHGHCDGKEEKFKIDCGLNF